jgi:hypothetical protein
MYRIWAEDCYGVHWSIGIAHDQDGMAGYLPVVMPCADDHSGEN